MLVPLLFLAYAPAAEPSLTELAAGVIAQKSRMPNRYVLRLQIEQRIPNAPRPLDAASRSTLHLWRDGDRYRVDCLDAEYTPPRPGHDSRWRHLTCDNGERDGFQVVATVSPDGIPPRELVEFRPFNHPLGRDYYCTYFDWRYFGLSNSMKNGYVHHKLPAEFNNFLAKPGVTCRWETRGEARCRVASRKSESYETSVWLSERDDFNPIYFESKHEINDGPETNWTEITWQTTPGGHRFPKTITNHSVIRVNLDKLYKLDREETVTVTHADFDSPIHPAVFTLAGLGLNDGQVIGFPELKPEDRPVWRNGKIDPDYTAGQRDRENYQNRTNTPPGQVATPAEKSPASDKNDAPVESVAQPPETDSSLTIIFGVIAVVMTLVSVTLALLLRRSWARQTEGL